MGGGKSGQNEIIETKMTKVSIVINKRLVLRIFMD